MENERQDKPYPEEDEINLLDLIKVILKNLRLIGIIIGVVVVATAIISLIMTPVYESKAVIMPTTQTKDIGVGSMLAQQFGISGPSSPMATEVVSLLKSNTLRERIIKRYNLLKLFFEDDYEELKKQKNENELLWMGLRRFDDITKVNFKQKDNTIEIVVGYKDPKIARDLVNYTLAELTDYMSIEAKRVAETNKKYLESQLENTADPFIKTKLYTLIAQQLETAMMAEVKENFAFKVLDAPMIPDKRSKPKRKLMVLIAFVVSLFIGIFAAFLREYMIKQQKAFEELKESTGFNFKRLRFFKRKKQ
ncbi:MAG TPA: Wzz/FepE/Etk N-terminal domain-containing protein [Syntrophorhabdaceae bacterium]|nr:Wzz/FepE/Etk N-terminal domain-containing protein [Syntrophorhabdaceae bacterium]HRV22744.1 Wzz/FepE/Etk N-terminal domain-containing protein [Syntrophorhabdaceae bacterium]